MSRDTHTGSSAAAEAHGRRDRIEAGRQRRAAWIATARRHSHAAHQQGNDTDPAADSLREAVSALLALVNEQNDAIEALENGE